MENEDMPPLEADNAALNGADADSDSGASSDEEVNDNADEPTKCLFCETICKSVDAGMDHLHAAHEINFAQLKSKFHMDQYSFIKLINCIRSEGDAISPKRLLKAQVAFWSDEKYLKPKEYEPWLSYDYDELPAAEGAETKECSDSATDLRSLVCALQVKVQQQALLLEQANENMSKMRVSFHRLMEKMPDARKNCVATATPRADEGYFSSYAHFGIHHEMLSDVVRTTSYRNALLHNQEFVKGKDVLDVGCGTSVLSIFASQAGAKSVVGIDNSDIIYNAMDIVKKNGIENVTLVKGRLEDTELPQAKYDIIISEWMGYFLLFEGMLDSVIYARDNHLKPGGVLLPNRCTMSLVGYGNDELFAKHVTFWSNVYELNMSTMRKEVMHEPLIDIVDPQHVLTTPNTIADLNLLTVDLNYSNFTYDFKLDCTRTGNLSAFVGYFDTFFDLPQPVAFGTGPNDEPTHWKQVVFFVEQPQAVAAGESVCGKLICRRSRNNARSLDIVIEVFGKRMTYYLD